MRADGLPQFGHYDHALYHYQKTKPIRGTEVRPLGKRRDYKVFRIEKHGEAIVCIMWGTPIATYYPNGTIQIRTGGWDTPTTARALHRLVPGSVYSTDGRLVIRLKSGEFPVDGLIIKVNAEGYWAPTNAEPCVVHKINRAKARAVRQRYAAFLTYAKGILSLMADDEGDVDTRGSKCVYLKGLPILALKATDDPDADVARWYGVVQKTMQGYRLSSVKAKQVMTDLDHMILKAHADEVLDKVVLPLGVLKKDKYAGWV